MKRRTGRFLARLLLSFGFLLLGAEWALAGVEPTPLRFWQLSLEPALAAEIERRFEAVNPGIDLTIETLSWEDGFEKLVLSVAARNEPDAFELGSTWIADFRRAGILADLGLLDRSIGSRLLLRGPGRTGDRADALPWLLGSRVLFLNESFLARAPGLRPPETWDELEKLCERLKDLGVPRPLGLAAADPYAPWHQFFSFAWGVDGSFLGDTFEASDLNHPAVRRAGELLRRLRPNVLANRPSELDRLFVEGSLPMVISGGWLPIVASRSAPDLPLLACRIPAPAGGTSRAFAGGEFLVGSARSSHRREVELLLDFLLSPPILARIVTEQPGLLPSRLPQDLEGQPGPNLPRRIIDARRILQDQLVTAIAPPSDPAWTRAEPALSSIVDRILLEGETPSEAITAASESLRRDSPRKSGKTGSVRGLLVVLEVVTAGALAVLLGRRRRPDPLGPAPWSVMGFWVILFGVLHLLPSLFLLVVSLTSFDLLGATFSWSGSANYRAILHDRGFLDAIRTTLVFVFSTVPPTLVLAIAGAYGLRALGRGRRWLEPFYYLPPVLPVVVTAALAAFLFTSNGPVEQVLRSIGVPQPEPSWLLSPRSALSVVAIHAVWTSFAYYTLFFVSALSSVSPSVEEAARLDGASAFRRFRSIDLPVLRPVIGIALALHTIRSLQVFPEILVMTRGGPAGSTTTVVYHLYEEAFRRFDFGRASAIATLLLGVVLLASIPGLLAGWLRGRAEASTGGSR